MNTILSTKAACYARVAYVSKAYVSKAQALLKGLAIGVVVALSVPPSVLADDTDIYLKPPVTSAPPVVMMMLAYRPNSGSTVCAKFIDGDGGAACSAKVGKAVWPNLVALVCDSVANRNGAGAVVCWYDETKPLLAQGVAPNDNVVDTDDVFRAILMTLMTDQELAGLKVGLMLSHDEKTAKDSLLTKRQVLSDGAMIMQGALLLSKNDIAGSWSDGTNNARDLLIKKIKELPPAAGATSHPFAPKENFYEYYQYLVGGDVFTGDNGYLDFGDKDQNSDKIAPETNFVSPNNPTCTVAGACVTTSNKTTAARYNLDAWGAAAVRNRDSGYWPTNILGATGMSPEVFPSFGNSWDKTICTGGNMPASVTNPSKSCFSCRNGEGAACKPSKYISPFDATECSKAFAITSYMTNNSDTSADSRIQTVLNSSKLVGEPAVSLANADGGVRQWLEWLYENDLNNFPDDGIQNVTTYLVADGNKFSEAESMAAVAGSAGYTLSLDEDPTALLEKLKKIFLNILVKSATFTAPSIPVNVFNSNEINDVAYMAMFQASEQPFWPGNVKKYTIDKGLYYDANGAPVYEYFTSAGRTFPRIKADALSFWTSPSDIIGTPEPADALPGKDGRAVRLGGAGQLLPGNQNASGVAINQYATTLGNNTGKDNGGAGVSRMLYTDDGTNLISFNASTAHTVLKTDMKVTAADMAVGGNLDLYTQELVGWARGNNIDPDGKVSAVSDFWGKPRSWFLGDVLHSRPQVVSYGGTGGVQNSRVFFGSNDGFMHQVTDNGGAKVAGGEVWAYMPQELLGTLKTWAKDSNLYPQHPAGVDGEAVAVKVDANANGIVESGDDVSLYFGLRRGGNAYYALNVTDPDAVPGLKWKVTNSTSGFSALGMTFGLPVIGRVSDATGSTPRAVFLAGGYNGGYDTSVDPPVRVGKDEYDVEGTNDSIGNTVYVVKASDGTLIWDASKHGPDGAKMVDSIVGAPTLLDTNGNRVADRAYVADTGGRVWRLDMPEGDLASWTTTLFADLGRHAPDAAGIQDDRRFFPSVSIVPTYDTDTKAPYLGIVLASGDREHPIEDKVTNSFFVIKDFSFASPLDSGFKAITRADMKDLTSNVYGTGTTDPGVNSWYFDFSIPGAAGEKSTSTIKVFGGSVFLTTYSPTAQTKCSIAEGRSFGYAIEFDGGQPLDLFDKPGAYTDVGEGMQPEFTLYTDLATPVDDPSTPGIDESQNPPGMEAYLGINGISYKLKDGMRQELYWRDIGIDAIKQQ